ncbi:xanthine dehydrogenase accessory protein XdhC [Simiduia sp. 21SJ11W-1]|uniref:xanthine dehydrogenase accessory protein XdhC n=1 Tax=Simiduia sp. 21SJ11W-1 TaxID=2909669 RepID=UPI0020A21B70|nr:xanthine dehydrogenase accessory protein XdhC [Simiduia sp. 21SJ11W-1]UTA48282.1 xanthine dehydrogenase accessory protein XdhC [Simiduia sp. 21SJ11W-1]
MNNLKWAQAINHCQQAGRGYVIATIVHAQGSTPRDGGSKMVIDNQHTYDTLGGGQLEFMVCQAARELLQKNTPAQQLQPFHLAAQTNQCCGGAVTVLLECFPACDWQLTIFGGGHVAKALLAIVGELPMQVRFIDSRTGMLPEALPANCRFDLSAQPVAEVANLPANGWVLVLTHDHQLDYQLCLALLRAPRWRFLGLIGSQTKARRFQQRLKHDGISDDLLEQLVCPVGLAQVQGKRPMEVAVSIAAQLQSLYYQGTRRHKAPTESWQTIKKMLRANTDTEAQSHDAP